MKTLLLTFDVEEFSLPRVLYNINLGKKELEISYEGLNNILKILDRNNIKATFFTTAVFAKKYRKLIKTIAKKHEIALHALDHTDDYSKFSEEETYKRLKKAKQIIEKIINKKIYGFRAPLFKKVSPDILKKLNIKYDSSLLPTYIPLSPTYTLGRFENLFKKRGISFENGITEVPLSVTPILRLPLIWIIFRNMPYFYTKLCTNLSLINNNFINLVFHPWEFVDLNKLNIPKLMKRNTGEKLINKLDKYLKWVNKKQIKSSTIKEYLSK